MATLAYRWKEEGGGGSWKSQVANIGRLSAIAADDKHKSEAVSWSNSTFINSFYVTNLGWFCQILLNSFIQYRGLHLMERGGEL
jgi:hypothetical protein